MKKILSYTALSLAILLEACSPEGLMPDEVEPVRLSVSATVGGSVERSRAVGTQWSAEDAIGVTGAGYTNIQYVTASGNGTFACGDETSSGEIYLKNAAEYTFSAYYPYSGSAGTAAGVISANTADQTQSELFDFLYATATASAASPTARFNFNHVMSQFNITLTPGEGITVEELTACRVQLVDVACDGTFDTATGVATATDGTTATAATAPKAGEGTATASFILFPQDVSGKTLVISLPEVDMQAKLPVCYMTAGNAYNFAVTVTRERVTVGGCTITGWIYDADQPLAVEQIRAIDLATYDGTPIEGTALLFGATDKPVLLADGAHIYFKGINANGGVRCQGSADIYLLGDNVVKNGLHLLSGPDCTMTIDGDETATLDATGTEYGAAIGCDEDTWPYGNTYGNVVINGGNITARSSDYSGTVIGSGWSATLNSITINGGKIVALAIDKDGYECQAVGIGAGMEGTVKNITINGGDITAVGGYEFPAIGVACMCNTDLENNWTEVTYSPECSISITGGTIDCTAGCLARTVIGVGAMSREMISDYEGCENASISVTGGDLTLRTRWMPYFLPEPNPNSPDNITITE